MRETVLITPRNGNLPLLVPETEAERVHGMNSGVYRPHGGMIFNFDPPSIASMTMEKTPMALQIAFVGPDRLVHTVYNAFPFSGIYSSPSLTRWVIETPAAWHVLHVGDRVGFRL